MGVKNDEKTILIIKSNLMSDIEHLRYPIGKFIMPNSIDNEVVDLWINDLEVLPKILKRTLNGLTESDFNLIYRPEGWTIKEVIHHMADSHMNAFIRIKLALTEDNPIVKPYFEDRWVKTADVTNVSPLISLQILEGIHQRWVALLKTCTPVDLQRTYYHPEHELSFPIVNIIGMYAWHSKHHTAHVQLALQQKKP